mmetsp:Transcript_98231/g.264035  ORF Transcript_98231/g.264035 Transcript_98231/m.264035 type:complete len:204 (+) Transcript_98231:398-1009(+)
MILNKQSVLIFTMGTKNFPQALVDKKVLTPQTITLAFLPEVIQTSLRSVPPSLHRVPREDLDGTVKAKLAVVEVDAELVICQRMVLDRSPKTVWKEDAVRVQLHGPLETSEVAVPHDLAPHLQEDPEVEGSVELAPAFAMQVARHLMCHDAWGKLEFQTAVDRVHVAVKYSGAVLKSDYEQRLLLTPRHHDCEAEELAVNFLR